MFSQKPQIFWNDTAQILFTDDEDVIFWNIISFLELENMLLIKWKVANINLNISQPQLETFWCKSNNFMFCHASEQTGSWRKKGEIIVDEIAAMVLHLCIKLHGTFLSPKSLNKLFSALISYSSFSSNYKRLRWGNWKRDVS